MNRLVNLVRNENTKLSHSVSTWIMIGLIIIAVVGFGLIARFGGPMQPESDWKVKITSQITQDKIELAETVNPQAKERVERRIQTNEYRLEHNIEPDGYLWGFVKDVSPILVSLIALFAIVMGGGIVANEFSSGTIKLLLIRPSKRYKILLSKYISVLIYSVFMLVILLITSFIVGVILFGFDGVDIPHLINTGGNIKEVNMFLHIIGNCLLECINLVMMVTLSFMISSVFRNGAMAIGIGVFLLTVGNMITSMLARYEWSKYILFANTDLTQYIDGQPFVEGMTMQFSIIVLIVYFVIFNVIAYLGFVKRDITA